MYLVLLSNRKGDVLNPKYEKQIKKGVLEILVLKLLENDEKYGYQLISELKEKSGGMFTLKEGTLYPILYRLEDEGLVISRWSEPKGKEISRKYYQITYKGGQELKELCELWNDFQKNVKEILEG
ncbi:MAG: PadR family transcriptional regulator [Lachnospiraceae bacterium]|nr:PadR family transcriptional regulator [Lachnospiraceae bacterium]